mmetsp:Transcript_13054/g.24008  ORF Transcript_13054/g.24008 Transcript_13054/m.24008 type:complete len:208 (-) Transcript_13054:10-633(-)
MHGLCAAFAGAAVLHLLTALIQAPIARAGWCWAIMGNPDSPYGCTTFDAIGVSPCDVAEECCAGFRCYLSNQCTMGAPDDDPHGPLFENVRPAMTRENETCEEGPNFQFTTPASSRSSQATLAMSTSLGGGGGGQGPAPTGAPGPTPAPTSGTTAVPIDQQAQTSSSSTETSTMSDRVYVVGAAPQFSVMLATVAVLMLHISLPWSQ